MSRDSFPEAVGDEGDLDQLSDQLDQLDPGAHRDLPPGGSVAGVWGVQASPAAETKSAFADDARPRYEAGVLIGSGGMGRVFATRDRRLLREVARTDVSPSAPADAAGRLAQEARITAQLEHPGIVAVYDAGTHDDGSPWYTMRLIRGRTLAEVLASPQGEELPRLLRSVLAAFQAVAFAHARGVIHRDLKPDNILVGDFGETQVIDWGLACFVDDAETRDGALGGTPAYMSPEQLRGEVATPRSDVWSLGATLYAAASGSWVFDGAGVETTIEERLQERSPPPSLDGPPALAAIVARALEADPAARYADAGELAEDLARYLDGRQVEAHTYSARELAVGLLRLWRAPLIVAGLALLILGVGASVAWVQNTEERIRAQEAERVAVASQRQSLEHLSRVLVGQARSAAETGDRALAETSAWAALDNGPSPGARGVLIAVDEGWRPKRSSLGPELGCDRASTVADDTWLCQRGNRLELRGADGQLLGDVSLGDREAQPLSQGFATLPDGGLLTWNQSGLTHRSSFRDREGTAVSVPRGFVPEWVASFPDPDDDDDDDDRLVLGRFLQWIVLDVQENTFTELSPCLEGIPGRSPRWIDGRLYVLCAEYLAVSEDTPNGLRFERRPLDFDRLGRAPSVFEAWRDNALVMATHQGRLAVIDRQTLAVRSMVTLSTVSINRLAVSAETGLVATVGDVQDVHVWRPGEAQAVRLPTTARAIGFDSAGNLVTLGTRREVWTFPEPPASRTVSMIAGLSRVVLSPDGTIAVGARGDGYLTWWELDGGGMASLEVSRGLVVKDVVFHPAGHGFYAGGAATGQPIVSFDVSGQHAPDFGSGPVRRLAALADGSLLRVDWGITGPALMKPGEADVYLNWSGPFHDLVASPSGEHVALARSSGDLVTAHVMGAVGALSEPRTHAGLNPGYLAVADDGSIAGTIAHESLRGGDTTPAAFILGSDGEVERRLFPGGLRPTAIAISPAGHLVAIGDLEGGIRIWDRRSGELLAEWRGHESRVSGLEFRFEHELISGSWDRTMKRWYLDTLRTPVAKLRVDR